MFLGQNIVELICLCEMKLIIEGSYWSITCPVIELLFESTFVESSSVLLLL